MRRGATALPAALATLAVSTALGAAVAELSRIEVILAEKRRAAATALAACDACAAEVVAALPAGWDFAPLLAGPDGRSGTADDGSLVAPTGCTAGAGGAPGPSDPPRALLRLEASAGGGRRALEVLVGRELAPGVPALLWLGGLPDADVSGVVTLDGADADDASAPAWSGLAAPDPPDALDRWLAAEGAHVVSGTRTGAPITARPPPLAVLAEHARSAGPRGADALVSAGAPAPALAFVDDDLVIDDARLGAGLLFVSGLLDIRGSLDFTGVVIAAGGVRIASAGRLAIDGTLWLGDPAAASPLLDVAGSLVLRQHRAAVAGADRLLALPRRARLLGARDLG
jgi:hypothetical protein